jgi:hypothetical protein
VIPLARRFAVATAALFAVAAVPVWLHAATGRTFDPCADPAALVRLPAYGSDYVQQVTGQGDGRLYAQSIRGELPQSDSALGPMRFWMLRGADPFFFYGHPDAIFISVPLPGDRREMHELAVGSERLPVRRRYDDSLDALRFSEYVLIQGTTPVRHPFTGGLSLALRQLVRGTEPVTMLLVEGVVGGAHDEAEIEAKSDAWLARAWNDYREACLP